MKILALVSEAYGARGGIAQYNRDFLEGLSHSPSVASIDVLPRRADVGASATPKGVRQRTPRPAKPTYSLGAAAFALRLRPNVIFCGHLFLAPLASLLARLTGARLLVQLHGIEIWSRPSRALRRALEAGDMVLCVSRDTRRRALTWTRLAPERVSVLPNTVSEAFTPGDPAAARRRLGLGDARVLLSVGRMARTEAYKGQDRVIAALPALIAKGLDVIYLVAGEGDDRLRLEDLARRAGVADRVRFLGAVASAELIDLYRAADLFVFPSTGEGFGIVFLEAMACGVQAMGLPVGGVPDALGDGELGTLVDEENLAQSIHDALQAPNPNPAHIAQAVRARFGRAAFQDRIGGLLARLKEPTL